MRKRGEKIDDFGGIVLILGGIIGGALGLAFYFLPSIIGFRKNQPNKVSILLLNLFLGWSLVGWVVSLVWATKKETQPVQVINNYNPPHDNGTRE